MIQVSTRATSGRAVVAVALAVSSMLVAASSAIGASAAVEAACMSDYFTFCSKHEPGSSGVRSCMKANGSKLSDQCVKALVADGEVSKADVAKRQANAK